MKFEEKTRANDYENLIFYRNGRKLWDETESSFGRANPDAQGRHFWRT